MRDYLYIFQRAININKSLGIRTAAGYCRNNKISLEGALWLLLKKDSRN